MTYPNGYTYRRKITIDYTQVSGSSNHTDTTIPFAGTYSYLADTSNGGLVTSSAGNDIRFELADGTKLSHDLAYYSNTTGTIEAWIKIPTIYYSIDTEIYVYYGKSGASAEEDKTNAWHSDFDSVYHLNENMNGTTNEVKDSKGSIDGTGGNGVANECPTQATGVTGVANQGQSFNPATYQQHINFGDVHDVGTGDKTAIAFVKTGATTTAMSIIAKSLYGGTNNRYYPLGFAGTGDLQSMCMFGATNVQSLWTDSPAHNDDTWRMYTSRVDRDGNNDLLVDGVVKATNSISAYSATDVNNAYDFLIGCYNDPDGVGRHNTYGGWDGEIDEVWMITGVRTDDWLATVSNAVLDPSTFYSVAAEETADWYDSAWKYRTKIEIDNTKVDADLTDYPIYIDLSDLNAGFHTNVNQTDGRDIRVTTSDGVTEVPREVVFYDSTTDTGELHFKGNILSTVNTSFYIYYGNSTATEPAASATYGSQNVWNSNYKAVYHMHETSGAIQDSTVNANHSVTTSGTPDYSQTGKLGDGIQFIDTSDENFSLGNGSDFDFGTGAFTIQNWIKTTQNATYKGILGKYNGSSTGIAIENHSGKYRAWVNGTTFDSTTSINTDAWVSLYTTRASSGGAIKGYVNGAQDGSSTNANTVNCTNNMYIGMFGSTANDLNGSLDETRFLNTELTSTWISTEYNNQNSPSTFYSVSAQEGYWYNTNWSYRVKITVDYTNVAEDLTNYPMYVDLSDLPTDFHTNVNQTDARDIRVTNYDGQTELAREVVAYDSTGDTGELHFLADSVSSTTNTDFYIYYGNAAASDYATTDTYGSEAVWTNYAYVSHDGGLVDSSGNLSPSNVGSTTTTGKMGDGRAFNGSTQYVNLNTTSLLDGATAASIQAWVYLTGTLTRDYPILAKWDGTGWLMWVDDSTSTASPISATDTVAWSVNTTGAGGRVNGSSGLVSQNTWAQFTSTFEASTALRMYKNGTQSQVMTTGVVSSVITDDAAAYVGNSSHASSIKWFQGTLDEIRLVTSTLSANWISTEYVNQSAPSTFYSLSTQESAPVATVDKTIQAKANITPAYTTVTKTVTAKARVKLSSTTKTIQAKVRVASAGVTKSIQSLARIDGSSSLSYDAFMNSAPSGYYLDSATDSISYRFIAKESLTVNQISVQFSDVTSAPTYLVGLKADSAGEPTGSYLTSGTVTPGANGWQDVTVSDYAITQGTTYHVVISYSSGTIGASNRVSMYGFNEYDTRYPYDLTEGNLKYLFSNDSGSTWTNTNQQPRFAINKAFGNPIDGWVQGRVYGDRYRGQRISFAEDTPISALGFWITKGGSPSGDLVCEIQTDAGATLATGTLGTPSQIEATYFNFYHATFSQITLSANTYYRVFIKTTGGDASNYYDCLGYTTGESSLQHLSYGGKFSQATVSNDSGSAWTEYPQYDFLFEVSNAKNIQAKARVFFYGAWSDTRSYTVTSPISTETKTVTAKARIKYANQTKSITAKARVKLLAVEKTIQAKSRIKSTGSTKSITAKARIKYVDVAKTITSKARIKYSSITKSVTSKARVKYSDVTKTITSKARVLLNTTKTITAKTRVKYASVTKSITAKTRVKLPTNKTITALARIKNYSTQTVQAKARIVSTGITKSIAAKARIKLVNQTKTTQAKARVKYSSVTKTVTSKARILLNKVKTITSKARIKLSTNKTISARADIRKLNVTKSIQAKARVKYSSVIKTIQAKARTKFVNITKNVTAKARILFVKTKSAQAKARVKLLSSKSIQAKARIASTGATQSIQAKARVKLLDITQSITARTRVKFIDVTKSVTAKARVLFNKTKSIQSKARILLNKDKTIQARARILVTQAKSITSKARVKLLTEKTISSKARIIGGGILKDVQAKARVKLLDITKTISSKARVKLLIEKSIEAKARVKYASVEKDIQSKARLKVLSEQSIQAKARIKATGSIQSIEAKARVKFADNTKSVTSKARVKLIDITKSVQTKSRIKLLTEKVIEAKARILVVASKSVQALARIKTTSVQSISAKARVVSTGVTKSVQALSRVKLITTRTISAKARIKKLRDKTISAKALIKYEATKTIQAKATVDKTVEKSIQAKAAIRLVDQTKTISAKSRIKSSGTTKSISAKAFIAILAPDDITVTHGAGIEDEVDNVVIEGQSKPTFIFVEGISKPTIESLYGSNILSGKIIINQVSGLTAPSIFKVV